MFVSEHCESVVEIELLVRGQDGYRILTDPFKRLLHQSLFTDRVAMIERSWTGVVAS